jgi:hypothetical protein
MSTNGSAGMPKFLVGFFLAGGLIILVSYLVG